MAKLRKIGIRAVFQLIVLLSLGLLANTGCGQVKRFTEGIGGMSNNNYATAEFGWGMGVSNYTLDAGDSEMSMEAIRPGNNLMLDSEGNVVARVDFGSGGRWGLSSGVLGSQDDSKKRLPARLKMLYYDAQEKQAYRIDAPLPTQKIYELFKQGFVDLSGKRLNYDQILVGLAPRGHVVVWVKEAAFMVEVASFEATKTNLDEQTLETFKNYSANIGLYEMQFWKDWTEETLAKIKAGLEPDPTPYLKKRIRYPWNLGNINGVKEVEYYRATINAERMMIWRRLLVHDREIVKPLPQRLDMYYDDPKDGKRYNVDVFFYKKDRVFEEPDISELQAIFERWYPNATAEEGTQGIPESEFVQFEFEFDREGGMTSIYVRKGNERIELNNARVKWRELPPNSYDGDAPTEQQLKNMRVGFSERVRSLDPCPRTGFWTCMHPEVKFEVFMVKGGKMPPPHYRYQHIDPKTVYWEWIGEDSPYNEG